jgi:hypothetical protein
VKTSHRWRAGLSGFGTQTGGYESAQPGWYLQGVYQFWPRWRVGLRFDRLDSGDLSNGLALAALAGPAAAALGIFACEPEWGAPASTWCSPWR